MRRRDLIGAIVAMAAFDALALWVHQPGLQIGAAAVALTFFAYACCRLTDGAIRIGASAPLQGVAWRFPQARVTIVDRTIAAAFACASFALSYPNYWLPPDKIFDEIYFARAAEEYLRNAAVYETTHPPLTKLVITLSVLLFGGLNGGDTASGWRFMDLTCSALAVGVLYVLARRVTGSRVWGAAAATFLLFDGMHFVQSRIATPEGIVVLLSLAAAYTLYAFWQHADEETPQRRRRRIPDGIVPVLLAVVAGAALAAAARIAWPPLLLPAAGCIAAWGAAGCYALVRWRDLAAAPRTAAWLAAFGLAAGLLVGSKWYGVVLFGAAAALMTLSCRSIPRGLACAALLFVATAAYAAVWVPDLVRQSPDPNEVHDLNDVVARQVSMFVYHDTLRATHPYASKWWEWPLDEVPVVYAYTPAPSPTPQACCVREVESLPNPFVLWFGLLAVPIVAVLAWRERNAAYAFAAIVYLAQWLPWAASPRITWAYHYYVDVPLVCLCNALVLQRAMRWARRRSDALAALVTPAVLAYVAAVVVAFAYFYPILANVPIAWGAWHARMWFPTWIIGPG